MKREVRFLWGIAGTIVDSSTCMQKLPSHCMHSLLLFEWKEDCEEAFGK